MARIVNTGSTITAVVQGRAPILVNQSGRVANSLADLTDVDAANKQDGSLLIYDEGTQKFLTSTVLEKQNINGGNF